MRLVAQTLALALAWTLLMAAPALAQRAPEPPRRFPPPSSAPTRAAMPTRDPAVRPAAHEESIARPPAPVAEQQPVAEQTPVAPQVAKSVPLPLAPRDATGQESAKSSKRNSSRSTSSTGSLLTVAGSLAMVLGLFFLVVVLMRRAYPKSLSQLPADVLEPLGRAALDARHQMHLVRCGNKLLLLAVSQTGAEPLTEITDPAEVDRISGLCRQRDPHSSSTAFSGILQQMSRESDGPGFVGRGTPSLVDVANRKK